MGWHYWYGHGMEGHRLILADTSTAADPVDGAENLAWHHAGGSNRQDKLSSWQSVRKLVSGKVPLSHFDFKKPQPQASSESGDLAQGEIHKVEVYRYEGAYPFKDAAHAAKVVKRGVERLEAAAKLFHGAGNCRNVQHGDPNRKRCVQTYAVDGRAHCRNFCLFFRQTVVSDIRNSAL